MGSLDELLAGLDYTYVQGPRSCSILGVTSDSRKVRPGWAFVAVQGSCADGLAYVDEALQRGATALVVERPLERPPASHVACLAVPDARRALAHLAAAFYGHPSRALRLIGITGTNGKTTSTYLLESILQAHDASAGVIGTVSYRYAGQAQPADHTTPAAEDLQRLLRDMVDAGVSHVIMEVSSHALAQDRVWGCRFAAALFTNLTQDHLDYHRDMSSYFAAKARLFTVYQPAVAVLNYDDPAGEALRRACAAPTLTYGFSPEADVSVAQLEMASHGTTLTVRLQGHDLSVRSQLIGRHNVYNMLGALAVAQGLALDPQHTVEGIERLTAVPGRFERVEAGQPFTVLVDYAHTDDALRNVLQAARGLGAGRIIVVFGAGGDRDRTKRPRMGRVAAEYADFTVITSDNPRTEAPMEIIRAIEAGFLQAGHSSRYCVIEDRTAAIYEAVSRARRGDIVIIAGKGHETYQILGHERRPFDDRQVALAALQASGFTMTPTASL
jgi:UDP-N-acetylmuramoyl-L-alanyl-D-glutamate--2,6-diaminopimelate ligase